MRNYKSKLVKILHSLNLWGYTKMRYISDLIGESTRDSTNEKSINIMQDENELNLIIIIIKSPNSDFSRHMIDDVGCVKCGWPLCSEKCPLLSVHRTAECTHLAKYRQSFQPFIHNRNCRRHSIGFLIWNSFIFSWPKLENLVLWISQLLIYSLSNIQKKCLKFNKSNVVCRNLTANKF